MRVFSQGMVGAPELFRHSMYLVAQGYIPILGIHYETFLTLIASAFLVVFMFYLYKRHFERYPTPPMN